MPIILTNDNYYSPEANKDYMSVSQFKDFAGTQYHRSCEATALKRLNGLIRQATSTSLLVGSYVDSYFEGTLDTFKKDHPELFKKTGDKGLKADYIQAEHIIQRINNDAVFSQYMSGEKQVIMTGKLFGTDWKIKMDSYHDGDKIVDLKIMRDMNPIWSEEKCQKIDFIRYWGYDIQGAIYQKIVEINTGKKLPFFIACATKEAACDIDIIEITQPYLDAAMDFVEQNIANVLAIKNGTIPARPCHNCYYCKTSKKITAPIKIDDLISTLPVRRNNNLNATGEDTNDEDNCLAYEAPSPDGVSLF